MYRKLYRTHLNEVAASDQIASKNYPSSLLLEYSSPFLIYLDFAILVPVQVSILNIGALFQ